MLSERNYSFQALLQTRECVIAIPTVEIAQRAVSCGNVSGRKVDKFRRFRLTPLPASMVKAPLIKECYANLECRVTDTRMVDKYNFFVLQEVKAWIDPARKAPRTVHHRGRGLFFAAGRPLRLSSKAR